MEFISCGPNRIAYKRVGTGPALLFVHGWPLSHTSYDAILPFFQSSFTCFLPDTPGLGQTEWSDETDFRFPAQAATLRQFVDQIDLKEYGIVAFDTGASIARLLADTDARVSRLVLLNTEIPGHKPPWIPLYRYLALLPGTPQIFGLLMSSNAFLRSPLAFGGCFFDKNRIDGAFVERSVKPVLGSPRRLEGVFRYLRGIEWNVVDSLAAVHGRLRMPVRLIWGANDPTFPIEHARNMVKQFRAGTELIEIPKACLLVHEEHPETVARETLRFLMS